MSAEKVVSIKTKITHSLRLFFLCIFFFLFNIDAGEARIVNVGVYENKPLVFVDRNGTPKGIFVDLLEYVAKKEKWEIKYIPGTWADCLDRLDKGDIDLLTAIAFSKERAKKYNFTYETVITNWAEVFVPKNSKITSVLDLESKKVAVKMQDIHYYALRDLTARFNINCRFIEADGYDVVFELIEAGRVKAGLVNRLFGLQNKPYYPVNETTIMFNPIEVRYAAPKQSKLDLITTIDVHLRKMQIEKNPFYTQTLKRWLVTPVMWELPKFVKYSLYGTGFVVLLIVAMIIILQKKVNSRTKELFSANKKLQKEGETREKAEDHLRRYERIVATSMDHLALIDRSYAYQTLNEAALQSVGKNRSDVIGKQIWDVMGDSSTLNVHKKRMNRAFAGQIVKYRSWMNFPTIGRRYMDIVYTPYAGSENKIDGCVANFRDITERHELELKLENAQKMEFMGTIAGGVAHDLNNILSGIVSYPDLLLMQLPKDSVLVKPILTIKKSGEKAAVIVQDLLTLARRGVSNKQVVNLNDIITVFVDSPECNKILSFHPNISIETDLDKKLNSISGSSVHLSKTVMNLVSNAAEAMPEGGEITIVTKVRYLNPTIMGDTKIPAGEYVLLQVSDNGIGISQEDINKVFEPFYTKKVMGRSGTGLGLAVVWGTVLDHHGYIDVKSDENTGTQFQLFFPATDDEANHPSDEQSFGHYHGNGESILVVDDVEEQRLIATDILAELGYVVVAVSSGEEAVSMLKEKTFDLVILDMLMLPGMDGLATYEELLKIYPGQKAIIASGYAETDRVKKALNLGVGQFVKKPYTIKEVGGAVDRELKA